MLPTRFIVFFDELYAIRNSIENLPVHMKKPAPRRPLLFPLLIMVYSVVMRMLMEALNNDNETTVQEALELLIKLVGTQLRFFRQQGE
ncbi:PREDICTED: importin-5 [Prunus dulcis]|uniref:PREDICTED: importin-5 n=1 Tax=Prunus dulcis TaxID=3755 RepID=A0A5E4FUT3_PRUDU|nr:PREDICTED: importin-5 [Prunus dulcis]